jgi:DNA-binding protein HU-beta
VNKAQLVDALAQRLGDKRTAGAAVDGLVDVIVRTVQKGEKVNIAGFGVFEKRARAARTARNPRTGEAVRVRKTNVPAFRAGSTFKDVISGAKKLPRAAAAVVGAGKPATKAAAKTAAAKTSATATVSGNSTKATTRTAARRPTAKR